MVHIKKLLLFSMLLILPASAEVPLDTLSIPAFGPKDTGTYVNSSIALESGFEYKIVIFGTYQFKTGVDWGYADAQYRMGVGKVYNQAFNSIEFDGVRVSADVSDVANHTYTFFKTGDGKKLKLSIYDTYTTGERGEYDNNAGSLRAEIYRLDTISLVRTISPENTELGNTTTVTLTLRNTGASELKNITVSDTIPEGFTLVSGAFEKNYDILKSQDSRSFQYAVKPSETGTFSFEPASVFYYDKEGSLRTGKSNISRIIVIPSSKPSATPPPNASVQLHGEKTDVVVGEDILLRLSAVNLITKPIMRVQVIILPPSGMSVTSSEFVQSGAGQFTTTYEIPPGKGRDIEVRIISNQIGEFEVQGRIVYYFDDIAKAEDYTLRLPIKVRQDNQPTPAATQNRKWIPGFELLLAIAGLLIIYLVKRR